MSNVRGVVCVVMCSVVVMADAETPRPPPLETVGVEKKDVPEEPTLVGPDVHATPEPPAASLASRSDSSADDDDDRLDPFNDVVLVGSLGAFRCTGVLIDPQHVLTAAHCVPADRIGIGNNAARASVIAVTHSAPHPSRDVALLTLASEVGISVRPRRAALDASPPLGVIKILGFGVSDQVRFTGFGQKRQLELAIDGWGCDLHRSAELNCAPGAEIVVRGGRGNDTCYGDSGGPLFERTPSGWRLLGITSRGTRPKRVLCGEGGVYTRIDAIADWINKGLRQ